MQERSILLHQLISVCSQQARIRDAELATHCVTDLKKKQQQQKTFYNKVTK